MYRSRIRISGELLVESPFHPGSGEEVDDTRLSKEEDVAPRIALVARDVNDTPYLHGTTLKGVIKRQVGMEDAKEEEGLLPLFGDIKDGEGGRMGRLIFYGSSMDKTGDATSLPFGNVRGDGVFAAARTVINPASGTAEEGKLFYQEMIAPGATFPLRLAYFGAVDDKGWKLLLRLLKSLQSGFSFGKGQADGQGRLRLLTEGLTAETEGLTSDGSLKRSSLPNFAQTVNGAPKIEQGPSWPLTLTCDGPFMIKDWSFDPESQEEDMEGRVQIKAQRRGEEQPELPGTSFMGALRARADWLYRTKRLKGEKSVERLFGTTEAAAVLRLDRLDAKSDCKLQSFTSVVIDRFSAAPVDNKLFTSEAFVKPEFTAHLSLDKGRMEDGDKGLVEGLLDDLIENGLMLGHGTNKGFGWFDVKGGEG